MKKSELTQLTQIIEHLVAKEIRKQLPTLISEVFQNMMNKPIINESKSQTEIAVVPKTEAEESEPELRASLKELFAGVTPTGLHVPDPAIEESVARPTKQYTKNPVLNQILNETKGDLRQREGLAGMAAFQGGYSPSAGISPEMNVGESQGQGQVQEPITGPISLPQGVSVLDVARQVPLAKPVARALTKNYSEMMKLVDKKRSGKL